jgi:hypothetical protein
LLFRVCPLTGYGDTKSPLRGFKKGYCWKRQSLRVRPAKFSMSFVSITRLRLRSGRYLPGFLLQAVHSVRQAKVSFGNLSVAILYDADLSFWTRTVWREEAAMRSFMLSGAHHRIMPRLLEWCDEAAVVHWVQGAQEPPSWLESHQRLQQEGRRSKVNHPSEGQRRFEIPVPRETFELKLKSTEV